MKRRLLGIGFALLLAGLAAAEVKPFAELYNDIAYYDTNVERKGFASLLGRFEGKLGVTLIDTVQLYGAYYATLSQAPNYWDNSLYYGPGLRCRPFNSFPKSNWQNEWVPDVKLFVESLSSTYFKDSVSGEANKRTDLRAGFDLWHEWNLDNPDMNNYWGELWSNLSYRSTNFSWTEFNNYIFYFQPKVGRHLGRGIEAYLVGYAVVSGQNDYWLNNAAYGVGIRFEPWRALMYENVLVRKFKMFAEALAVSYFKGRPADPLKDVSSDMRIGIDFSSGR